MIDPQEDVTSGMTQETKNEDSQKRCQTSRRNQLDSHLMGPYFTLRRKLDVQASRPQQEQMPTIQAGYRDQIDNA